MDFACPGNSTTLESFQFLQCKSHDAFVDSAQWISLRIQKTQNHITDRPRLLQQLLVALPAIPHAAGAPIPAIESPDRHTPHPPAVPDAGFFCNLSIETNALRRSTETIPVRKLIGTGHSISRCSPHRLGGMPHRTFFPDRRSSAPG